MFSEGVHRHAVLQAAAMAAKWWEPPRDALDAMVLNAAALHELEGYSHTDYMPFDPSIKVGSPLIMARNSETFHFHPKCSQEGHLPGRVFHAIVTSAHWGHTPSVWRSGAPTHVHCHGTNRSCRPCVL